MSINLTNDQIHALAAMVELGTQDRAHYLNTYAADNEDTPAQISAGHREIDTASEALALIKSAHGTETTPENEPAADVTIEGGDGPSNIFTISADFHVTGNHNDLRAPIERAVADVLEDASHDGTFSIPGASASFLTAEITSVYKHIQD